MTTTTLSLNLNHHEKSAPIAEGDILVTEPFGRVIVRSVDDNIHGLVYLAYRLDNGNKCIVMPREIVCRSV